MDNPKFNIGDLIILSKNGAFLEKYWMCDPLYANKTIRSHHYTTVKKNTLCMVLNIYGAIYEVLILTEDLMVKSLVIFVTSLDRIAENLNDFP